MQRETTGRQKERRRRRRGGRKLQERQTDRRSVKRPGRDRKEKGAVLWLINLLGGVLRRKKRRQHSLSNEQSHNADNDLTDGGRKEGGEGDMEGREYRK